MKIKISPDIISRVVQDEEVILNLNTGVYFGLNPTGTVIWENLQKNLPLDEITDLISESFDVSKEEANQDVHDLVKNLVKNELIQIDG